MRHIYEKLYGDIKPQLISKYWIPQWSGKNPDPSGRKLKVFEEERELTVLLLIDVSSSGVFGSKSKLKIDLGVEIAAMLGFSAIKNNDKVGLILFSDEILKYIPPKKGRSHVLRLITDLVNHDYDKKQSQTSIKNALEFASKISRRKNVMFVISDFMDDNFWTEMKYLNFNHDVIGIQIYDLFEKEFPDLGLIKVLKFNK